jgi:chromosomal replication initiator protein
VDTLLIIWEKALEILKQDLASIRYDTWIKTLSPIKKTNNVLYFQTLNPVHKELVEKSYRGMILSAVANSMDSLGIDPENSDVVFLDAEEVATL